MESSKFWRHGIAVGAAILFVSICSPGLAQEKDVAAEQQVVAAQGDFANEKVLPEVVDGKTQQEEQKNNAGSDGQTASISPAAVLPEDLSKRSQPLQSVPGQQEEAIGKTVTRVEIVGNKNIPMDKIIPALRVRPGAALSLDSVNQDLQMIYETGWFYGVRAEYSFVPEGVRVVYRVDENPILSRVEITGSTVYADNLLKRLLGLEDDQVINSKRLNEGMRTIEATYNHDGYILARVSDINMQPDGVLKVAINEGIVEGFIITGNKKTRDRVILRELKLYEGEPFNVNDGRRSMQRVYNLGFFEDVNIKLNPGRTPNGVEVEISVVETSTGTFGIGAGYSEADGIVGMLMLGDKNLRGTGDRINVRWEFGGASNRNYDFSYFRPWVDSRGTGIGFNLYDITHEYEELDDNGDSKAYYEKRRKGMEFLASRPANDYITDSLTVRFRDDIYVKPVEGEEPQYYEVDPANRIPENFGKTHSVVLARSVDMRDNVFNPSRGCYYSLSGEFAGWMGGDFTFDKYIAEARQYHPVGLNKVIAFRAVAGYANGTMPVSQRFALGGSDTLRGYKDDRFRGYKMLSGTAEYRFPVSKNFQGVVFTDVGYAWDKGENVNLGDMEYGYGVGLRINSPLGPIRVDYAYGDKWRIHFSFGGQF